MTMQTTTRSIGAFDRDAVLALSEALSEPSWLRESRLAAWDRFASGAGLPRWEGCNLEGFSLDDWIPVSGRCGDPDAPLFSIARPGVRNGALSAVVLQSNGGWIEGDVDPDLRRRGLLVTSLADAVARHPDLVRGTLLSTGIGASFGRLQDLHAAFFRGGAFIRVPAGMDVPRPVQIVSTFDEDGGALFDHNLIIVEQGASVTMTERISASHGSAGGLHMGNTELLAREGARVRYAVYGDWGDGVWSFAPRRARIGKDAFVMWIPATLGGRFVKTLTQSDLDGAGSRADIQEVFIAGGVQRVHLESDTTHRSHHTQGEIVARGVLNGRASGYYRGVITVPPGARQTAASLHERMLMLSEECQADTVPCMIVEENDVRASHSASVGQIDEEMIFYLMARGIPRAAAEGMIVAGFFEPMIQRIPLPGMQTEIRELIAGKLGVERREP